MTALTSATEFQPGTAATSTQWLVLVVLPVALLVIAAAALVVTGEGSWTPPGMVRRAGSSLARLLGLSPWSAAGLALAAWALLMADHGFYWDVAWHADLGRDDVLFTPAHTMILLGLLGIAAAAVLSTALATMERADVGLQLGRLRIPWGALPLGALGVAAVGAFPLDDLWHRTYGIDVTMWSPTHLLMIGGAALSPIALCLLVAESPTAAGRARTRRVIGILLGIAVLCGLGAFDTEFDLGIPQWQALYGPVLVALAMSLSLTAARAALGRGHALLVAAGFVVARIGIAAFVGADLGRTVPHFPLALGVAAAIEVVWLLAEGRRLRPLTLALLSGGAAGTAGMATEWGFNHLWSYDPWQPRLLAGMWVAVLIALAGGVLGMGLGRVVAGRRLGLPVAAVAAAAVSLPLLLAVPYPRQGTDVVATVSAVPAGPSVAVVDAHGRAGFQQLMTVHVHVSPATGADAADRFEVIAWQGGGVVRRPLQQVGPGDFVADGPVPTGGPWKSLVALDRGAVVAAVPVEFPADAVYGLPAIPAPVAAPAVATFVPSSAYLTREAHDGNPLPRILADVLLGVAATTWIGLLILGSIRIGRTAPRSGEEAARPAPRRRAVAAIS